MSRRGSVSKLLFVYKLRHLLYVPNRYLTDIGTIGKGLSPDIYPIKTLNSFLFITSEALVSGETIRIYASPTGLYSQIAILSFPFKGTGHPQLYTTTLRLFATNRDFRLGLF